MTAIQDASLSRKFALLALPLLAACQILAWSAQSQNPKELSETAQPTPEASQPDSAKSKSEQAQQYYDQGLNYKRLGWTEKARAALNMAIEADPDGVGKRASIYLKAYIPSHPVEQEFINLNILGYHQMNSNDQDNAIETFKLCIARAPEFEWPYGNLSSVYTEQGKIKEAIEVANKILAKNPNYINGWLHLTRANIAAKDAKSARESLAKAAAIDATNEFIPELKAKIVLLEIDSQQK